MNKGCTLRESNFVAPLSALLLDSSLITTTKRSRLYNIKLVNCSEYIQLYYQEEKKIIKEKKEDNAELYLKKISNSSNTCTDDYKEIEFKNIIRSKLECQRLAKCNIEDWNTFITLTFADNITDINIANKKLNYFCNKVRRVFPNFMYLCIPEFQKRGAVHYHLLTNINVNNTELIYKQETNKKFLHVKYWNEGFTSVEKLNGDKKKIIGYISKYMTKDIDNRLFGRRRYFYSLNLKKPRVEYLDLENLKHKKYLEKLINNKKVVYENIYINPYNNEKILFKEFHN